LAPASSSPPVTIGRKPPLSRAPIVLRRSQPILPHRHPREVHREHHERDENHDIKIRAGAADKEEGESQDGGRFGQGCRDDRRAGQPGEQQFGKDAVKTLEERFQVPKIGKDGKPKDDTVLDEPAFCAEIEKALTDLQPVADSELNTLALDRAVGIKNILVQTSAVDPTRIFILDPDDQGALENAKVRLVLELSS
jgi:hypothetical protein